MTVVESAAIDELLSVSNGIRNFPSISGLLEHLRTSPSNPQSDVLLCELVAARIANPAFIESLLVLAFLPMLHHTIRRVASHQPTLSPEDITQQTLSILLQFLRSKELRTRESHLAFAISRAVKRQVFEWANRESAQNGMMNNGNGELLAAMMVEELFERYTLLRHFLHRCVRKGLINDSELDLLIQFKLDRNRGEEPGLGDEAASNALRQRLKRLLAKLRQLAR